MSENKEKKPVMTPRKTAVTAPEKKAQIFRIGFVATILLAMLLAPGFINRISERNLPTAASVNWLPEVGLTYIDAHDVVAILLDESDTGYFVYIGRPTCPFCVQFEPLLLETLTNLDLGLRYFEIDESFATDTDLTNEVLIEIRNRGWAGGVPVIKFFVEGQIVDSISGVQSVEEVTYFFERNGGLE